MERAGQKRPALFLHLNLQWTCDSEDLTPN